MRIKALKVRQQPKNERPARLGCVSYKIGIKLYDFRLKETSPARNSGVASGVSLDLDGRPRPVDAPDLGAYEN